MQYSYLTLVDSFINYFFDTLTDQAASQKLNYFVYWTVMNTLKSGKKIIAESKDRESQDGDMSEQQRLIQLSSLRHKIFTALCSTFEAK